MIVYIIRRLLMVAIVLVIVSVLVFVAMRMLPGDPIRMLLTGSELAELTEEQIDKIREEFGLNDPLPINTSIDKGGFSWRPGNVILHRAPANEILRRLPITLHLGLVSFVVGFLLAFLPVVCAVRRGNGLIRWLPLFPM
jgi:peptide/nickel transport system permease protein